MFIAADRKRYSEKLMVNKEKTTKQLWWLNKLIIVRKNKYSKSVCTDNGCTQKKIFIMTEIDRIEFKNHKY